MEGGNEFEGGRKREGGKEWWDDDYKQRFIDRG